MDISIILPTFNRRELVLRTLLTLFAQTYPLDRFEIIVVVDGSSDGTAEALEGLKPRRCLRVIEQENRGLAGARNTGYRAAKSELVLFLDDDIICGPDVLKRHVEAHLGIEPVVAYGAISLAPGTPASVLKYANESWYKNYYGTLNSQGGLKWPKDVYLISNSSLRRSTLLTRPALEGRLGGLAQDARRATPARRVRPRHHRSPQGAAHDPFAYAAPGIPSHRGRHPEFALARRAGCRGPGRGRSDH